MTPSPTHATGIYLDLEAGEGMPHRLAAALAACRIEAVLIRPPAGRASPAASIRDLCVEAQAAGAAALVHGSPALALEIGADGVHLPWSEDIETAYADARRHLGKDRIVGAEAGNSRHDAMVLGEAGADYVAFSAPDGDAGALGDLMTWWSEIFEVPSVAMDQTRIDDALDLAGRGADFIGWRLVTGQTAADQIAKLRTLADRLGQDTSGAGGGRIPDRARQAP